MRAEGGPYRAHDIARACSGVVLNGDPGSVFDAISTDSRDIKRNDLFVPLSGPNFDGHEFVFPALEAGAGGSLVDRDLNREIPQHLTNCVLIQVQDTLRALSDLASAHRRVYHTPLIAVTGSSGKTTVKEMIASVLKRSGHPLVSQGNLNNLIGLPMTVLSLGSHHSTAVVEAGINHLGEMDFLARAASPDTAVITSIGPVHLEGLQSIEMVAREKFKLVEALSSKGTAVLPSPNDYLESLAEHCEAKVVTFGLESGDYTASNVTFDQPIHFQMHTPVGMQEVELDTVGRHNITNALAASAACVSLGLSLDQVAAGLQAFRPPQWRMEILNLPGNRRLIRDCYNANPHSVKAALQVLSQGNLGSKTLAILADMMELGEYAESLHEETGRTAARLGIDRVVFVGAYGRSFSKGFLSAGGDEKALTIALDKEAAWDVIGADVHTFEAILVKGSRVMRMECLADRISQEN